MARGVGGNTALLLLAESAENNEGNPTAGPYSLNSRKLASLSKGMVS